MTGHEVQSIGVLSLAKILGVMGLMWGVLMVFVTSFVGVLGGGMMGPGGMGGMQIVVWLVGGLLYGLILGAITAIVYNAAASLIGGVELGLA